MDGPDADGGILARSGRQPAGNITRTSDGTATTFATYDANNRVVETRDALGNATTYGYNATGCGCSLDDLVTNIHTPDLPAGVDWLMAYDADNRLASVTDPHAFTESYSYETTGELKKLTDKLLRDTTWSHDQLGRVSAMVDTLGRKHGNLYTVPSSGAWTGPTLMAGSADSAAPPTSLGAALPNGHYQIGQNAFPNSGFPAGVTLYRDATFELSFSRLFDTNQRMTRRYDRAGLAIDTTSAPAAPTFWSNQDSWSVFTPGLVPTLVSSTKPGGSGESGTFAQDAFFDATNDDGFASGSEARMNETFTRDAAGRVTQLSRNYSGAGFTPSAFGILSTYTYRADGRVGRLVNPDGTHDFTYDSRGLMETQVVTGEGTYSYGYDVMGRNHSLGYPDGHTRTQLFDDLGRMTSRCYEYSGPTTRCYTAQYDAVGNPTRMTDPDGADRFDYDALDRLKKVTREVGGVDVAVEDYDYNALGALKLNAGVALDTQRPRLDGGGMADAAVPASLGGQPVTLNAGGFVTSLRGTMFTWSERGFLREAQDPIPAVLEHYGYDAMLRRISKQQGSDAEFYVFEGMDRVATVGAGGAHKEQYLFDGIDHPLRITIPATGTIAYYEVDLAGNVRGLRASGGASLGGYRYSAFGQTLEDTSLINQPLRWKGRWFSLVAGGTYDVRARQWSAELGIFLAVDELAFHDKKTTLWSWPNENSIRFDDPTGRGPLDFARCIYNGGSVLSCVGQEINKGQSGPAGDNRNGDGLTGGILPPTTPPGGAGPSGNDNGTTLEEYCVLKGEEAREACLAKETCQTLESFARCAEIGQVTYLMCKKNRFRSIP